MGESIDVRALRAKFNTQTSILDTSNRNNSSQSSPKLGLRRPILPLTENDMAHHRLPPMVLSPPTATGPGLARVPRAEPLANSIPSKPFSFPRPPPTPAVRACIQPIDADKVKQPVEIPPNLMLMLQRPPGSKPGPAPSPAPGQGAAPAPASVPQRLQPPPRQRSTGDVTPLRKPLPPDGPLPLKPKRPPQVNLEPFLRSKHRPTLPERRLQDVPPLSSDRKTSSPAVISPPKLPQRSIKPTRLSNQAASIDIEDNQETYDDIASVEKNESWSDTSQCMDGDTEDLYQSIDEEQREINQANTAKNNKKEAQRLKEQAKKEQMERRKKESNLKKKFQLCGEVEVLHTARVRHDWYGGGKLDLSVRQDENVEIIRVKNNPGGKWLARSMNGKYGYISNTCVDIDYEAVKRNVLQNRKMDLTPLPLLPPEPPQMLNMESSKTDSTIEDDDDYDDVQPMSDDFPPPPPEICTDSVVRKELKKKFKYDGPLTVLHTMMVDPNSTIKKPGGKDLGITRGEVLDVIQLTNNKKALCRNQFGKYGYVSRSLLLQMEGDIYDDVEYPGDIYDND